MLEDVLKNYKFLKAEMQNLLLDLEDEPDYIPTSRVVESGKCSARGNISRVEILALEGDSKTIKRIKDIDKSLRKVDNILACLSDRDRRIIVGYYLENKTILELSYEFNLEYNYVSILKNKIIHKYFKN